MEIAQDVFGASGYRVTYEAVGWARCIADARSGRFTAIIGASRPDPRDFTFPNVPIGNSRTSYVVRKGDPFRYTGTRALEQRVLGITGSYSYPGEIGDYITAHSGDDRRVESVSGDNALEKNLAKLIAGRVDLVLDDENVLRSKIAALGLADQVTLIQGSYSGPFYIAFSPADPDRAELARMLDRGIERLRADGRLAAILARYHVRGGS